MFYYLFNSLNKIIDFTEASAHCDIPCKIYDPISAQVASLTVIRLLDLINELSQKEALNLSEQAQLSRLVSQKEEHAMKVKEEITIIWGDYFKEPQFKQFPDSHELVHSIMLQASKCKQFINRDEGIKLLALVNKFASHFWKSKNIKTYSAKCPYPPSELVVYPVLNED